jgi:putative SOS response-associated peptidase YedK
LKEILNRTEIADINDRTPNILPRDKEEQYLDNKLKRKDLENLKASNLKIKSLEK